MQNKGAIRLFAITLALVSLYQLSFTYFSQRVKKQAEEYAQGDPKKEQEYLDSVSSKPVYYFLGFKKFDWAVKKYTYKEVQGREMNLGLDLKGGMNVTLEVDLEDIIRSLSNYNMDTTFTRALQLARQMQKDAQEDFIVLFGRAFEQLNPNGRLAAIFTTEQLKNRINFNSSNAEVLSVIKEEATDAINNTFNILDTRINRFGVAQPNIYKLQTHGRIMVELPGIKEPERVRRLLQGTANLEFWETYENQEAYKYLLDANAKLKEILDAEEQLKSAKEDTKSTELAGQIQPDTLTGTAEEPLSLVEQLDTLGTDTTMMARDQQLKNFPLFAVLTPNVDNAGSIRSGSTIGLAHIKDTSKVNNYLKMPQIRSIFPRDMKFHWEVKAFDEAGSYFNLHAIKVTTRDGRAPLDGSVITAARDDFDENSGYAEVSMSMDGEGSKKWERMTRDNVGRCIAIVLDDYVYSAPVVSNEIKGGNSSISGRFDIGEAQDLANVLKSGKLPAPARIIQETVVGPSLGKKAIDSGLNSFLIAFVVILLYMLFYYGKRAGLVADLALIANMFFLMGVLASLGAVLTLPGIAGIVLTIGMSVDANVLIYERIREELAAGKGLKLAISDGYKNAYSAIIDANVTTLLTGIILVLFGSGPIKGFATTLIIGITTSLFSAIFITRLVLESLLSKNRNIVFDTSITRNLFRNTKIKFLELRKIFYVISVGLILVAIVSLVTRGLNPGIDFKGGRTYVVKFDEDVAPDQVRDLLTDAFGGQAPEVKQFGTDQIKIATKYKIEDSSVEADNEVENILYQGLKPLLRDIDFNTFIRDYRLSSEKVGPTIADDLKRESAIAIVFALVIIFLYILIRFRNWQYGLGAVVALVHDSLIVLGIFSLFYGRLPFSLEIDQAFIAAILTVVGYSVNDTVIVFDRIREYIGLYPKRERGEIINSALNSTLSRTFNTSFSTIVVLLSIFILGGEVIRGFTFALLIGIVVGTYSSLFIATPVVYDTILKIGNKKNKENKEKK